MRGESLLPTLITNQTPAAATMHNPAFFHSDFRIKSSATPNKAPGIPQLTNLESRIFQNFSRFKGVFWSLDSSAICQFG